MGEPFPYCSSTLTFATVAFALWLGCAVDRAHRQRQAVNTILASGGAVRYAHQLSESIDAQVDFDEHQEENENAAPPPPGPDWLRRCLGDDYFVTVVGAACYGKQRAGRSDCLKVLRNLPDLKALKLAGFDVSLERLENLRGLNRLESLHLTGPRLVTGGAQALTELRSLVDLQLLLPMGCDISGWGIAKLTGLRRLCVSFPHLRDQDVLAIASLARLESLRISLLDGCDDKCLWPLGKLRELRELAIRSSHVTGAFLTQLSGLTHLERFELNSPRLVEDRLIDLNPRLKYVSLRNCRITDRGLSLLSKLKSLRQIDHYGGIPGSGDITGEGFPDLASLTELEEIQLDVTDVTDSRLLHLAHCKALRLLWITSSRVTRNGNAALQSMLPRCIVLARGEDSQ